MAKVLTRDEILAAQDIKQETVPAREWGGDVIVRSCTALEQDAYQESMFRPELVGKKTEVKSNYRNSKARLVVKCVIGEDGKRLFSDDDAEALGQKNAATILRIFRVIQRLSGMDDEAEKVLEKNSEPAQTEDSPSS